MVFGCLGSNEADDNPDEMMVMMMTGEGIPPLVSARMEALGEGKVLQDFQHHKDFYKGVSGSLSLVSLLVCIAAAIFGARQSLPEYPSDSDRRLPGTMKKLASPVASRARTEPAPVRTPNRRRVL